MKKLNIISLKSINGGKKCRIIDVRCHAYNIGYAMAKADYSGTYNVPYMT